MKKIFLFIFVVLFMLLLPLSVLAAETLSFTLKPENDFYDMVPGSFSGGMISYTVYFPSFSVSASGVTNCIEIIEDGVSMYYFPFHYYNPDLDLLCILTFAIADTSVIGEPGSVVVSGSSDDGFFTSDIVLEISPYHTPSFSDSIDSALSSVLTWIQSFTSALFSGDLSPLLSVFLIGICIAALFLGIRFIYKTCWGC